MDRVQGVNSPGMLRPSLEIKALHNLIGRYWNGIVPPDSMMSGANMPIVQYLHEHRDSDVFQYDIERAFFHHSLHRVPRARTHGKEGSDHAFRRRLGCARAQDRAHAHRV